MKSVHTTLMMCGLAPTAITVSCSDLAVSFLPMERTTEKRTGSITLLFQRASEPGLEVLGPQDEWSPVPVYPMGTEKDPFPPILVNVGDLLSYWTNGFLKSTVHRVVLPPESRTAARYSIAYFCHPVNQTRLTAVPSPLISGYKTLSEVSVSSREMTAEEHLKDRLAVTYGWDKEAGKKN